MGSPKYDRINKGNPYGFSRMTTKEIRAVKATIGLNDNSKASPRSFHAGMDQFASGILSRQNPELLARVQGMTVDGHRPSHEEMAIMKVQAAMGFVDTTAIVKGSPEETQRALDSIKQMGEEEFNRFSATTVGQGAYDQLSDRAKFAHDHLNIQGMSPEAVQKTLQDIKDRRIIDGKFGKVSHGAFEVFMEPGSPGFEAAQAQDNAAAPTAPVAVAAPAQPLPETATAAPAATPATAQPTQPVAAASEAPAATQYRGPLPRPRPEMAAAPAVKPEQPSPIERGVGAVKDGVTTIFDGAASIGGKIVNGAVDLGGQAVDGIKNGAGAVIDAVTPETRTLKPQVAQVARPVAPVPGAIDGGIYTRDSQFAAMGNSAMFPMDRPAGIQKLLKTPISIEDDKHVRITIPAGANPDAYREQLLLSVVAAKNAPDVNKRVGDPKMKIPAFERPENISKVEPPNSEFGTNSSSIVVRSDFFDDVNLQRILRADARDHRGLFSPSINPDNAVAATPDKPAATAATAAASKPVTGAKDTSRIEAKPLPPLPEQQVGAAPATVAAAPEAEAPRGKPINVRMPKPRPNIEAEAKPTTAEAAPYARGPVQVKPLYAPLPSGGTANVGTPQPAAPSSPITLPTPSAATDFTQAPIPGSEYQPQPQPQAQPQAQAEAPAATTPAPTPAAEEGWFTGTTAAITGALNSINPWGTATPTNAQPQQAAAASAPAQNPVLQEVAGADLPMGELYTARPQQPQAQAQTPAAAAPTPAPAASEGWFAATGAALASAFNGINPWGETTPKIVTAAEAAKSFDPKSLTQQKVAMDGGDASKAAEKQFNFYQSPGGQAEFASRDVVLKEQYRVGEKLQDPQYKSGDLLRIGETMRKDMSVAKIDGTNMYVVSSASGHTASREALSKFIGEDVPENAFAKTKAFTVGDDRKATLWDADKLYSENVDLNTGKLKPGHNPGLQPWYTVGRPIEMDKKQWDGLSQQQQHDQGVRLPSNMPVETWNQQLQLIDIGAAKPETLSAKIDEFNRSIRPNLAVTNIAMPSLVPNPGYSPRTGVPIDEIKAFKAISENAHRFSFDFKNPAIISEDVYKKLIAKMEDPKNMVAMLPVETGKTVTVDNPKTLEERLAAGHKAATPTEPGPNRAGLKGEQAQSATDASTAKGNDKPKDQSRVGTSSKDQARNELQGQTSDKPVSTKEVLCKKPDMAKTKYCQP